MTSRPTPTTSGHVPAPVAAAIVALLTRHDVTHLVAPILTALAGHLRDTPTHGSTAPGVGVAVVDLALVRQLVALLARHQALDLLDRVLVTVTPYLVQPEPPALTAGVGSGAPLTTREREVLHGIAGGSTNGEIGRGLFLTEDTVKTHARRLYAKLGARDRAHAVRLAFDRGYLVAVPEQHTPSPAQAAS